MTEAAPQPSSESADEAPVESTGLESVESQTLMAYAVGGIALAAVVTSAVMVLAHYPGERSDRQAAADRAPVAVDAGNAPDTSAPDTAAALPAPAVRPVWATVPAESVQEEEPVPAAAVDFTVTESVEEPAAPADPAGGAVPETPPSVVTVYTEEIQTSPDEEVFPVAVVLDEGPLGAAPEIEPTSLRIVVDLGPAPADDPPAVIAPRASSLDSVQPVATAAVVEPSAALSVDVAPAGEDGLENLSAPADDVVAVVEEAPTAPPVEVSPTVTAVEVPSAAEPRPRAEPPPAAAYPPRGWQPAYPPRGYAPWYPYAPAPRTPSER